MASTSTSTTVESAPSAPSAPIQRRTPKDDMKSTWRSWDPSKWNRHMKMIDMLGVNPTDLDKAIPTHSKTEKMPYLPHWENHKWVLAHACWPLVLHQIYVSLTGRALHPLACFLFYSLAYKVNGVHELRLLKRLGHTYGFLDGDKHARDQMPDASVSSIMKALTYTSTFRPMFTVFLAYRRAAPPSSIAWLMLPIEIGLYGIVLDFYFYWYHRAMHEFDGLWKFHRTHHLTKHPSPLLTLFADHEQEVFDIAIVPIVTYVTMRAMGFPMGFYEWWLCHQYIVLSELWGHSGLRVRVTPPTPATPLLWLAGGQLVTEDHDLHHRKGYRKSHNYGKQTFLWDRVFGTQAERIEMGDENVDWDRPIKLPWW